VATPRSNPRQRPGTKPRRQGPGSGHRPPPEPPDPPPLDTVGPLDQEPAWSGRPIELGRIFPDLPLGLALVQFHRSLIQLLISAGMALGRAPARCRRALRRFRRHPAFPVVCWLVGLGTGPAGVAAHYLLHIPIPLVQSLLKQPTASHLTLTFALLAAH
jgi:hypothetical protein